ncbi:hypothetical protein PIB30_055772 [Stylosanthes scabra]|uniref:PGG domain-containing protein n=1 Tax=Stylosanthes scabra TaxID=79078 RepID=A0ABU6XHG0_9FABA|nr:hypothetical protein [Stylosanthes scabra]
MDQRLLNALRKNDITTFSILVKENEEILYERTAGSFNTSLHLASKYGCTEMVLEILRLCPDMVFYENKNLETPVHEACRKKNVKILMLLLDACKLNPVGKCPLSLACRNGHLDVIKFLLNAPLIMWPRAAVFHENCILIAASSGHIDIVRELLNEWPELTEVIDENGNSALHLSVIEGHYKLAEFLINKTNLNINAMNNFGFTALDILDQALDSAEKKQLQATFIRAEGLDEMVSFSSRRLEKKHKHQSQKKMENLNQLYYAKRSKHKEIHKEALLNARNTIIIVAALIATVTFASGITPPGGVYQEGPMKGKSMVATTTAFKVFTICNNIALFTSLSIVIVLVSIIPFKRKPQMRLLRVTHKIMWVAIGFMSTGYVAATWVILPHDEGMQWLSVVLIALVGTSLITIFIGLSVMLVEHWLRKSRWRKTRKKAANFEVESLDSDFESACSRGYYSF